MTALTDFLLARIAEDEDAARAARGRNGAAWDTLDLNHSGWRVTGSKAPGHPHTFGDEEYRFELWDDEGAMGMWPETAAHVARQDPAHVLLRCRALRDIVELHTPLEGEDCCPSCGDLVTYCRTLSALGYSYVSHPDYRRDEWRP